MKITTYKSAHGGCVVNLNVIEVKVVSMYDEKRHPKDIYNGKARSFLLCDEVSFSTRPLSFMMMALFFL